MRPWNPERLDPERLIVLDRDECLELLAAAPVGRIAFCREGVPTVVPVNHAVDSWAVVFQTGYGSKLSAALLGESVAFEADGFDEDLRTGWSVLVRGRASHVTDPDHVRRLERLSVDTWADGVERPRWVQIALEDVTGRRIPTDDHEQVTRRGPPERP